MTTLPARRTTAADILLPRHASKDTRSRMTVFAAWLDAGGGAWWRPDLAAYRDHLAQRLAPSSVAAHLSTIRGQYAALLTDNAFLEFVEQRISDTLGVDVSEADRQAHVTRFVRTIENAIAPAAAPVRVITHQDRADSEHTRLTRSQAAALMNAPDTDTKKGLRDTALIAFLLCTGLREAELVALEVDDLRQRLGGQLAVSVRDGKGAKARLVPYGELSWVLWHVDAWLSAAGISAGPVWWSFYNGGKLRGVLTGRSVQRIVGAYPVAVDGELVAVKPHDLRRTYARRLYDAGTDLVAIQQNLGHADLKTTQLYIGALDADARAPADIYPQFR